MRQFGRVLFATCVVLAMFLASSHAQNTTNSTTPSPSSGSSGTIDPSVFASLLKQFGVPAGSCQVYDRNQSVLSQCNRVVNWPQVYVFQGLNQTSLDLVAYNSTFKSLYKQLALNCSTALVRLTCIELYLPCVVIPIPLGPPPTPVYNLSIPFTPCPGLCHDVYQYCGYSIAHSAGCANSTFAPPSPPSAPAPPSANSTGAPAAPSGIPPGIPPAFLPILEQIEMLPCATAPFNNTLFTRVCAPFTTDNPDDDDNGPCAAQCPTPLFSYTERLALSITVAVMASFSVFYCLFSALAILTHPVYRHFPKNAIGWLFCSLFWITWADFIRLFYLGGNVDGIICVHGIRADFTHAPCGFQAVCLIIGLSGVLWWDVLVINLFLAAYQLPRPEGVWNRVFHACCHLIIWPFNITMIVLIASFGIVADGIMTCAPDTSIWSGWMADSLFFIPFGVFMIFGFSILTLVVLRILWVLRSKTLAKGASLRMVFYLAYGYMETTYFLTFHWENRIRQSGISSTYTRYVTCLVNTLPWLRDAQCHVDGDHFHFSELVVAEILGALAPWVAFYLLMTKYTMWAHWVWAFRVYILRQKDLKMPFEESLRRKNVSRRMTRTGTGTGTSTASTSEGSTMSATGFTMDMPE